MSVPPLSVPIEIVVTGKIFPCPTGASLREVVDAIRDDSLLIGGHLERNGVAVIGGSITDEGIYRFVGGEVRSIAKGTGLCDNIDQLSFKYNRGTTTESFKTPILFEDLRDAVQDKWDIFTISDFEMHTEKGKICITPDNCQQLISSDMAILVSSLSVGFSDMKKEDVMAYAGISVLYEKDHSKFADYVFNTSSASILENEVNYIFHDLTRRVNAFSNALRSETTMREFISPFLISAVLIVGNIDFYCERSLRGSRANGAVDYVAIYRAFIICVTEAKKLEIEKGVSQNIAQMKASRESFQVHEATKRHKKRNFKEVINEAAYLHELPSTGIISTGEQWQFLRYEFIEERWNVFSSDILEISLSEFRDEDNEVHLKKSITNILLKIAGLLDFQKQKCDNAPVTKKNKVDETPNY